MDARLKQAVAVGRLGSFSKAAEAVNVTQSAVTKSVADLERRIGFPIFLRTYRGVVPTSEGRAFLERASRLLADTDELLSGSYRTDPFSGNVRIGIGDNPSKDGFLPTNADRVRQMADLSRTLGREVATVDDVRARFARLG